MRVVTPQILWHVRSEPVFSIDWHPSGRVATGGADNDVKIWKYHKNNSPEQLFEWIANLSRHNRAVNVVRFSPKNGAYLASGSDDGTIFIWKHNENVAQPQLTSTTNTNTNTTDLPMDELKEDDDLKNKENWTVVSVLRAHLQDVYDLSWSPDGTQLMSASTDRTVFIWDALKGKQIQQFKDHTHYVQGVAWDPLDMFLATQSADRTCRVWAKAPNKQKYSLYSTLRNIEIPNEAKTTANSKSEQTTTSITTDSNSTTTTTNDNTTIQNGTTVQPTNSNSNNTNNHNNNTTTTTTTTTAIPSSNGTTTSTTLTTSEPGAPKSDVVKHKMFGEEAVNTFFRRLCWTIDGSLLLVPFGLYPDLSKPKHTPINVTFVFARNSLHKPIAILPVQQKPTVCVRCHPFRFEKKNTTTTSSTFLKLPYRLIWAIATLDYILIYDSDEMMPIACIEDINCAEITDLSWSADGLDLLVASLDGYCTVITFDQGELGTHYNGPPAPITSSSPPVIPTATISTTNTTTGNSNATTTQSNGVNHTSPKKSVSNSNNLNNNVNITTTSSSSTTNIPTSTQPATQPMDLDKK